MPLIPQVHVLVRPFRRQLRSERFYNTHYLYCLWIYSGSTQKAAPLKGPNVISLHSQKGWRPAEAQASRVSSKEQRVDAPGPSRITGLAGSTTTLVGVRRAGSKANHEVLTVDLQWNNPSPIARLGESSRKRTNHSQPMWSQDSAAFQAEGDDDRQTASQQRYRSNTGGGIMN